MKELFICPLSWIIHSSLLVETWAPCELYIEIFASKQFNYLNVLLTVKRTFNAIQSQMSWILVKTWWAVIGFEVQFGSSLLWRWLEMFVFWLCCSRTDQSSPCPNFWCVIYHLLIYAWDFTCYLLRPLTCIPWENISILHMIGNMVWWWIFLEN